MRIHILLLIVLALGGGIVGSMVVADLTGDRAPEPTREETTRIYVALREIREGERFDERNVRLAHRPTRGLPAGVVEQIEQLRSRVAAQGIAAGQPIQSTHFASVASASTAMNEPSPARTVTIELAADRAGPWVVSTGDDVRVASLEEFYRQALEIARRNVNDSPGSLAAPEPQVAPADLAGPTAFPPTHAVADDRDEQELAGGRIIRSPGMSSVITPEGAKILRWRKPTAGEAPIGGATAVPASAAALHVSSSLEGQRCDLLGETLAGQPFDVGDYRGRPVLLVVYLARGALGREELSLVERMVAQHRYRGLQVIGVGLDENPEVVRAFARHNQWDWPSVVGPLARQWARAAHLESELSLVVVNDEGRVTAVGNNAWQVAEPLALACAGATESQAPLRQARRTTASPSQP